MAANLPRKSKPAHRKMARRMAWIKSALSPPPIRAWHPVPIAKIASGGELARFMLALKVSLAAEGHSGTMIFDEVDAGVGGAVAEAVGTRLHRLAQSGQVLVVTHSPQVAARGNFHWQVSKSGEKRNRSAPASYRSTIRRGWKKWRACCQVPASLMRRGRRRNAYWRSGDGGREVG
jgi:ABC-type glutathione transport system ATPase component